MAKPAEVIVKWDQKTNEVTCDEEVVIYFDDPKEPDSILWVPEDELPPGRAIKIAWDVMSPFFKVSRDLSSGGILGTWNNGEPGVYDYSVLIVDTATRQVVAGFDPKVRNEPPVVES